MPCNKPWLSKDDREMLKILGAAAIFATITAGPVQFWNMEQAKKNASNVTETAEANTGMNTPHPL